MLEIRTLESSQFDQLGPLLLNGSSPQPHTLHSTSDHLCVRINFQKRLLLLFLYIYNSPTIKNTQFDIRARTFSPELFPNSPDTFILGNFNAHYPIWNSHISPDSASNYLFNWISSSQLNTFNDLDRYNLSTTPLAPVPVQMFRWLLLMQPQHVNGASSHAWVPTTSLLLTTMRHSNTRAPAFNFKKAHWDEIPKNQHRLPSPLFDETRNIHCAARSFSLILNAATAYIPFGSLGRSPKAWWCEKQSWL